MKILIIDNGTKHLVRLKRLLGNKSFETIKYSEIDQDYVSKFDVVILSGGCKFPVNGHEKLLQKEIDFVKNSKAKIFGICFGFELIASAFGAKLEPMEKREKGIIEIQVIKRSKIFSRLPNFEVFESHRWVVKKTTDKLLALAKSKDGIEAIKHKTKPIYAVQFHPEMFIDKTCGDEIFNNFLELFQ